ncbi:MAG: DUF1549 and DUF1553 domain-containing protein [Planctomycetaceae bacterium]
MSIRLITIVERCAGAAIASVLVVTTFAQEPAPMKSGHWAFQSLRTPVLPAVPEIARVRSPVDRFVLAKLSEQGLSLNPEADKPTLIRRVAFDLTGLPPTRGELAEFVADQSPDAYERMIERYLASPHYGERWGKWWLDVAGYADSNGYFNADSDRPLAYRYRDYVIRSMNADKPFDQFIREQIAGDELSGFDPKQHERHATPEMIDMLEATHFLRNGPDGSGESDGNPEEVMIDRYFALEGTQQILSSSLLGLTIQCSKCHDHKFEPITQHEFYQLQAYLHPVFNMQKWLKPNERFTHAALPGEVEAWEAQQREAETRVAALRAEFTRWLRENRPVAGVLFSDDFDGPELSFLANWSNTAPGDDAPGGTGTVTLAFGGDVILEAPAAVRAKGTLRIIEGGPSGDKWISTKRAFDWTPNQPGEWIQATFDLIDNKVSPDEKPAERIAFFLSLHDFNDNGSTAGGNILIDGNPAGGAAVHLDYPGTDQSHRGTIGKSGYAPGRNFGVRVTNLDGQKFKLEQLVDWLPEERTLELSAVDLPDGGFGFEFCCNRSFIIDNVSVESSTGSTQNEAAQAALKTFRSDYESRRKTLADAVSEVQKRQTARPGKIAWASDVATERPNVPILLRGNVTTPGEFVHPAPLRVLATEARVLANAATNRTALAEWLTRSDSPASALIARVQANRIWERHFGRGLVTTLDNLGVSGAPPSHPELLEWLASELARPNADSREPKAVIPFFTWSLKRLHREILHSATYRQSSQLHESAFAVDPDNRLLWRQSVRRLDAEAIRDGMLFVSGSLERRLGGPYVPTQRSSAAEVVVSESQPGTHRRSVYLQQRRTQTLSLLNLFDAPAVTFNCVQRPTTTMPLQSLSQLNSEFSLARAGDFARRLDREAPPDPRHRAQLAFEWATGHMPAEIELRAALSFVEEQTRAYEPATDASRRAWIDFCQMLLSSNGFLYVE